MRYLAATALAVTILGSAAAWAEQIVDATDAEAIRAIASGFGSAELTTDSSGDPMITGRIDGVPYDITFYGCTGNTNCEELLLRAGFVDKGHTEAEMNAWNRDGRWGKAYIDAEGDPVIELNASLYGGVTRENIDRTFELWQWLLGEFRTYIDF